MKQRATWPRPVPLIGDQTSAAERRADPAAWAFSKTERNALYDIINARRDVRRFRPDPLDDQLVQRLLAAAHAAPSVGHSQPWRFALVSNATTRERAASIAERERIRQAELLDDDARRAMLDLQLHGIREAPVGIVVCCDRRTDANGVLGRATFADADLWSCACAIENLWLAARGEGLGVGWVTFFPPAELASLIGLPDGVETLGWLCVGWPDERLATPGLERAAWSERAPLSDVVFDEYWEGSGPKQPLSRAKAPDQTSVVRARDASDTLLSPPGSLGVLDQALDRLSALGHSGACRACLVLVGADHLLTKHGVSSYPTHVTREVLEATVAGESLGAAAARVGGFKVIAIDAGVEGQPVRGAESCRALGPRGDLVNKDALTEDDVEHLFRYGRDLGANTIDTPIVAIGEVGIGNTTIAAAMCSAMLDIEPSESIGRGASGDTEILKRKTEVVAAALSCARRQHGNESLREPATALASLGGPEFAVLTGVILGVADRGSLTVLDGYATSIAALCALRIDPGVATHLIAGQQSREQGHHAVLVELGLEPLLDLRLRAGEGVGAVLASQLLLHGMKTRSLAGRVDESPR